MGSGNSQFTSEQAKEISQAIKTEYDLCRKKGLQGTEEQERLLQKYRAVTQQLSTGTGITLEISQSKAVISNSKRLNRGYSKDEAGIQVKNTRTRRRSFDNKPVANTSKKTKDMTQSSSIPSLEAKVLEEPPQQVDTWDSVNGQPSCLICSMVFTNPQKLETHIKYSSLHVSNLKKLQEASEIIVEVPQKPVEPSSLEPSARCRVIYTGTKFFWKTQDNIDLHLYYHIDMKCIEVIAYEGKANTELPRLYLNEIALMKHLGEDVIMDRVRELQKDASNKRFKEALPPVQILFEEEKRIAISSHIISHLQMVSSSTNGTGSALPGSPSPAAALFTSKKQLKYVLFSDEVVESNQNGMTTEDILYSSKPDSVIPVYIARRRHTSEEEIKETLTDINAMQMDIRSMTQKAEKMAGHVSKASASLSSGMKKRKWRKEHLSAMRIKWLWAIDFVIRKNRVAFTKQILEKYNGKY